MKNLITISFEHGLHPKPESHELEAARIIAEYYKTNVLFLRHIKKVIIITKDKKVLEII